MEYKRRLEYADWNTTKEINNFLNNLENHKNIYKICTGNSWLGIFWWKDIYICDKCGLELEVEHCESCEKKENLCEGCGVMKAKDAKFCYNCGDLYEVVVP